MGLDFANTRCVVLWGLDVENSYRPLYYRDIQQALGNGAQLIVIDPRKTRMAERADLWLQVRPGTDCALALGMLHVIINERLYDQQFVEQWTVGFAELKQHVQQYPLRKVAEITQVPAEKIAAAARMYAQHTPACIGTGTGGLCQNTNAFQTNRAITILASIQGNLDITGGHINYPVSLKDKATMLSLYDAPFGHLSAGQIGKRLSVGRVIKHDGYILSHPEAVWPAITDSKPYPVKAMLSLATNAVVAKENSRLVRETLMKLDLLGVQDLFMTPTAEIADYVLPVAHWTEREEVIDAYTRNYVFCHRRLVDPPAECWEDKKILIALAGKMGMKGYWKTVEESLDERLQRLGITFAQFREKGLVEVPFQYSKHEKFGGFKTSTKKVELYSARLAELGSNPLPVYREPPESPASTPELAQKYPLILITGIKSQGYFHSAYRNIPGLRRLDPEPLLEIHPEAAQERGIKDGEWVEIVTPRGCVKHKARLSEKIAPRVVAAPHGWWYGYQDGWKVVNINVLTDGHSYDPDVGSSPLKGLLCEVRKADSPPVLAK